MAVEMYRYWFSERQKKLQQHLREEVHPAMFVTINGQKVEYTQCARVSTITAESAPKFDDVVCLGDAPQETWE